MPMPFEKLRLENPTDKDITVFKYQGRQDPRGLEAPEFEEDVVAGGSPVGPHMFVDSTPLKMPGHKLYEDIKNIHIVDLTVDGQTLGTWVMSTGDAPSCIREVVVEVQKVKELPPLYQAMATVWYRDEAGEETYFEYYSAPF